MTLLNEREQAFEAKFAHDEELRFKMMARRGRLFAEWVAQQLALGDADTARYVTAINEGLVQPGGQHDLVDKALADLAAAGSALSRADVVVAFEKFERMAKREIMAEQTKS